MPRNILRSGIAAAAALFIPTFSGVASAEAPVVRHVTIEHADLDLTTDAGIATLKHRAESAVKEACGPVEKYHESALFEGYQACYSAAMTEAMTAADHAAADARAKHQVAAAP